MENTRNAKDGKSKLNMRTTLIMFALIPMIVSVVALSILFVVGITKELKSSTNNAMVAMIKETGAAFDAATDNNEAILQGYAKAPVVREYLKNTSDTELAKKAQQYTLDYFGTLDGWEGLYLADWGSKVLTHESDAVIGKVLREGDSLKTLQNSMLSADGTYNTGIMTSPASGNIVMSLYTPVYDESKNPIGYAGGATFVNSVASKFADVSSLNLSSAYIYFVDGQGTMLYHPDESKIGNPVENAAVKGLVARIANGEHPEPECISYLYKGANKYAAYYVGPNNSYIAVLTADEKDVMSNVQSLIILTIILSVVFVLFFLILTIVISRAISDPLKSVAGAIEQLGTGDVTVSCDATSHIKETVSVIGAFQALKNALNSSMTNVNDSAGKLNAAILSVDSQTSKNAESIGQINSAIDEVAKTSQAVAESAQLMAEKASELGEDIDVLNENVNELYDASSIIREANQDATNCMKDVYAGANESVEAVQDISVKISETNKAIVEIGNAIGAIEEIASQTNLLSLNASIEAARAGESGKGFAVVADEIRSLADNSANSAKDIKRIIENVMGLSNETVEISNRVFEVINKEQADIETTQSKFTTLSESVEASISGIDTIRTLTEKLDDIKANLTSSTTDLGAISEELGASAQEVAASCQNVSSSCADTQASASDMREVNENMSSAIGFFKLA